LFASQVLRWIKEFALKLQTDLRDTADSLAAGQLPDVIEIGISHFHTVACGKSQTHMIESVNSSICDNLARFNRESKRFSKCQKMLEYVLSLFFKNKKYKNNL
jgi:hypothetical protein